MKAEKRAASQPDMMLGQLGPSPLSGETVQAYVIACRSAPVSNDWRLHAQHLQED